MSGIDESVSPGKTLGGDDAFGSPETMDEATAVRWAGALDQRAASPDQQRLRALAVEAGRIAPGQRVAEIGCGTGRLLVELANTVGPSGSVTGIEPIAVLAQHARERVGLEGLSSRVAIHAARAETVQLRQLDACVAQTTMVHVPAANQLPLLQHAVQWLRDGGCFVTVDQDGDTWTIAHPDRARTRRIIQYNSDQRYGDGWFARRARRLMHLAGLGDVTIGSATHIESDPNGYLRGMADRVAAAAAQRGVISPEEHRTWIDGLRAHGDEDAFFSSITYFISVAWKNRRPGLRE